MNKGVHISRENGYTQAEVVALIRNEVEKAVASLRAEITEELNEVESGTITATSGTLLSGAFIKKNGRVVVLDYGASGVDIPTTNTKIGTITADFAPTETTFTDGLIGFGAATPCCYFEVTSEGDIRIRGTTAQSSVTLRAHLVWIQ